MSDEALSPEVEGDGLRLTLRGLATDPITRDHARTGTFYELGALRKIHDLISKLSGFHRSNWMIDAGANIGNHTTYLAGRLPRLKIVSFEMNPRTYAYLDGNVKASGYTNIETHNFGLSDQPGFCGIRQNSANPLGGAQLDMKSGGRDVELIKIDDYLAGSPPAGRCIFLKLDVEGHEENVLKGADKLLQQHQPMIFVELKEVAEFRRVSELLSGYGYSIAYAEDDALPNFLFCHKEDMRILFTSEDLEQVRAKLCGRIVDAWQLYRTIRRLQAEINTLKNNAGAASG